MSHLSFVLLSYGAAALVLGCLIGWLWLDARTTSSALKQLEESGVRRRSDRSSDG
ncbi:MAG: heme exporter protein CcmD [Pseudomonadota bacterium]